MPSTLLATALLFVSPSVAAGADVQADMKAPKPVVLREADHDKETRVPPGTDLEVRLEAQLGTGYSWSVAKLDEKRLERAGEPSVESTGEGRPGSKETQVFRFRTKAQGRSTLELEYSRPWEKDARPLRTFRVVLEVAP